MEDEIDLGKYFRILARRWKWIVGLAALASAAAFIASSLVQPTYEASALILVTRPRYQFQFDPRIQTVLQPQPAYRLYQDLALSGDVLAQLANRLAEDSSTSAPTDLRDRLSVQSGSDQSLLRLTATDVDPQRAQTIANAWAEAYLDHVNALSQPGTDEVAFFELQAAQKQEQLQAAEQALVDFEQRSQLRVLELEMQGWESSLVNYVAFEQRLATTQQDVRSLQARLARLDAEETVPLADALAVLSLQAGAQGAQSDGAIQLQASGDILSAGRTAREQTAALDEAMQALEEKADAIRKQIETLEQDILSRRKILQEARAESDRLTRERDLVREGWLTLVRKLDEARLAVQTGSGEVRLASQAALPTIPVPSRRNFNVLVGGILGLVIGVAGAFFLDARRSPSPKLSTSIHPADKAV